MATVEPVVDDSFEREVLQSPTPVLIHSMPPRQFPDSQSEHVAAVYQAKMNRSNDRANSSGSRRAWVTSMRRRNQAKMGDEISADAELRLLSGTKSSLDVGASWAAEARRS